MRKKTELVKFTKMSDYMATYHKSGLYTTFCYENETEKAIGVKAQKPNSYANLYDCFCYFPKSQVSLVENDFYIHDGPEIKYAIVPFWLYEAKCREGFIL
jgi:hypothetical protein